MRLLERVPVVYKPDPALEGSHEHTELVARLNEQLGYSGEPEVLARYQRDEAKRVMQETCLYPLSKEQVEEAKREREQAAKPTSIKVPVSRIYLTIVLLGLGGALMLMSKFWGEQPVATVLFLTGMVLVIAAGSAFPRATKIEVHTWQRIPLGQFGLIPEFVLQTVDKLSTKLPFAEFYVDELAKDPYLVMVVGGDVYYMERWGDDDVRL